MQTYVSYVKTADLDLPARAASARSTAGSPRLPAKFAERRRRPTSSARTRFASAAMRRSRVPATEREALLAAAQRGAVIAITASR